MTTEARCEIVPLTALRGLAAVSVVALHFTDWLGDGWRARHDLGFVAHGYLWVDFFFMLSGFVLGLAHAERFRGGAPDGFYARFVVSRLARIYPLHLVTLLLILLAELAKYRLTYAGEPPFSLNTPASFLDHLLLIQAWGATQPATWNLPSWSISAEWGAYLAFPLFATLLWRPRAPILAAALGLALLAGLAAVIRLNGHPTLEQVIGAGALPRCLLDFAGGMLICRLHLAARRHRRPALTAIGSDASAFLALTAVALALQYGLYDPLVVALMAWLITALAANQGRARAALSLPPLRWLGLISYSIYLDHFLILKIWKLVYQRVFHEQIGGLGALLAFLAVLGAVLAMAVVTWRFVERPGQRWVLSWAVPVRRSAPGLPGRRTEPDRGAAMPPPDHRPQEA
ncbi:MAG: acyltransferase [Rhodospirillales bacterium]|nr:acyltransferase [Rhodospirillales bacterium]MDE2199811.1 acyltransferase [Rhodospirillales bacterium]MDE2575402.1 acyltransferase [Rhodospirillales bacterium]